MRFSTVVRRVSDSVSSLWEPSTSRLKEAAVLEDDLILPRDLSALGVSKELRHRESLRQLPYSATQINRMKGAVLLVPLAFPIEDLFMKPALRVVVISSRDELLDLLAKHRMSVKPGYIMLAKEMDPRGIAVLALRAATCDLQMRDATFLEYLTGVALGRLFSRGMHERPCTFPIGDQSIIVQISPDRRQIEVELSRYPSDYLVRPQVLTVR